jgi:hypothetical protein
MTVSELGDRMSAHELQQWVVFYRLRAEKAQAEQDKREGVVRDQLPAPPVFG